MSDDRVTCPKCGSQNTKRLKSGDVYCKECEHEFAPEAPFEPLRVFISYGHDEHVAVALRLRDDLNQRGHEAWFDEERLHPGHDWEASIERGLQWAANSGQKAALVLLLTPHSVRRPDGYCLNEVARALTLGLRIIPLMVVDSEPPLSICRIQWLDLRECIPIHEREDRYAPKVERLLAALEQNRLDFEGTQSRLLRALAPMEFSARILEKLQDFTGRQWVFDQVDRWMNDPAGSKIFWLTGAPGVGKTAVAAWVQQHRREVAAFHFCDIHHEEKRNPAKMVRSIAYQLSTQLPEYEARLAQLTPTVDAIVQEYHEAYTLFDKLVIQPLTQSFPAPDRTLVVLIDALDEATFERQNEIAHFLGSCAHLTPPWLRFLVTSRPDEPEIKPHLQSLDPYVLDTAREENLADLREYLRAQLPSITPAQTEGIVERSEGVFLYVTHVTEEVKVGRLCLDRLEEFPRGLGDVYAGFFKRQFGKELAFYEEKITPLLQVVFAAFEPLTLADLKKVCHLPDATELGRRLNRLGSLFPTRGHGDTATLQPFHRSLVDWITDRNAAGHYWLDVRDGHRLLAEQGLAEYHAGATALSPYLLRYLPAHLCELGHWDALAGDDTTPGVLTDLRYIQAKCTAGLTHDLVGDYNQVLSQMPGAQDDSTEAAIRLRHFSNFVSHHLGVLTEYPAETLPIAVNYADSGPVVTQAERLLDEGKVPHLRRNPRPPLIPLRPACLRIFEGHTNDREDGLRLTSVAVTPDGKRLFSVGMNIRQWDLDTGACLRKFPGSWGDALVTSEGNLIIFNRNEAVKLDDDTGICTHILCSDKLWLRDNYGIFIAVTPDGKIISSDFDPSLRIWDIETGRCLKVFKGHGLFTSCALVAQDGKRIVSGDFDGSVAVWDIDTGRCLRVFEGHRERVEAVAITPNGMHICSLEFGNTIRVWNMESGRCLYLKEFHERMIKGVAVTLDGKQFITMEDGAIRVWDILSGVCLKVFEGLESYVFSVGFLPDGKRMITGSIDGTIRLWDLSGEPYSSLETHKSFVMELGYASEKKIVSKSEDGGIIIWDLETKKCLSRSESYRNTKTDGDRYIYLNRKNILITKVENTGSQLVLKGHTKWVSDIKIIGDNKLLSWSDDTTIRVWDLEAGVCLRILKGHRGGAKNIIIYNNVRNIVSWCSDATIRIWDLETGKCLHLLKGHKRSIDNVLLTPDEEKIVSWGADEDIRIWDLKTGTCLHILNGHKNSILNVLMTTNGDRVISLGADSTIRLWDIKTGSCIYVLESNGRTIDKVILSPDGKRIVSCEGRVIRILDTEAGECLHYLSCRDEGVHGVNDLINITPNGNLLIFCSKSGDANCDTYINILDINYSTHVKIHHGLVKYPAMMQIKLTPDSKKIIFNENKTIRIYNISTGKVENVFQFFSKITTFIISSKGDQIIAGTEDGQVHILTTMNFTLCETPMLTEL